MINPIWLRSFCALVEIGHFTRTAVQLNMTQSGVSQHVSKLEELLGLPLLLRQGKGFVLTDAGERLYKEGKNILNAFSELERRVGEDSPYEGVVRIASPGSVGLKLYDHLLGLQKLHPNLVIDYRFAPNDEVEKWVAENKVDIGLMTRQSQLADVSILPIAEEELLLVTSSEVKEATWSVLQTLGFIDHPDGDYHMNLLLGVNFDTCGGSKELKKTGFSNQISLILEPVAMGLGFSILPAHAVAAFPRQHEIKVHNLEKAVRETLYLGVYSKKTVSSRVETVIQSIKICLEEES